MITTFQKCFERPKDLNFDIQDFLEEQSGEGDEIAELGALSLGTDQRDWHARKVLTDEEQPVPRKRMDSPEETRSGKASEVQREKQSAASEIKVHKAANAWLPGMNVHDEEEKTVRIIKGILNKLTPDKFDRLVKQALEANINSAPLLQRCISLVFEKAVAEPTFCPLYARLCKRLSDGLPDFPSSTDGGKPVTFRRALLNTCQDEFEGTAMQKVKLDSISSAQQREIAERAVKQRTLGNIRLIGELFKEKMVPEQIIQVCISELVGESGSLSEENVEPLCQLMSVTGKILDSSVAARPILDSCMSSLQKVSETPSLPSRTRFMIKVGLCSVFCANTAYAAKKKNNHQSLN